MKTYSKTYSLVGAVLLALSVGSLRAQLLPVDAGAVSTNTGSKLAFVNGASYSASSGYVHPFTYQRFANRYFTNVLYGTSNFLFRALSSSNASSAAVGSYIACQIVSVTGPAGGVLSFWEQGAKWPTYQFPVNGAYATGKNRFILSNCETGAGRPDGDPVGSILGRRFTVNKPGEYAVTFKLYDTSENHPLLKGPIHAPSDPLTIKFKTGVDMNITSFSTSNDVARLTYKQGWLTNMVVEANTNLTSGSWVAVAGPFATTPTLTTNLFTNSPGTLAIFYRLRGTEPSE